jgi:hypothetical protein
MQWDNLRKLDLQVFDIQQVDFSKHYNDRDDVNDLLYSHIFCHIYAEIISERKCIF